jgi:hypothetical protein
MPAAWTLQGTAVHAAIEQFELSGRSLPLAEVIDFYYLTWDTGLTKLEEAEPNKDLWLTGTWNVKGPTDAARRRERGAAQVAAYLDHVRSSPFEIWESPGGPAVELEFRIELGGVEVLGYIDQVLEAPDGELWVRDIKTGTKLPESALQLGVYAEAVYQLSGIRPRWGDYFMCKNNAPTKPYDLSSYTADRLGRWFARLDRAVQVGAFIPNPGDACRTCSVSRWCDAVGSDPDTYGGSDLD